MKISVVIPVYNGAKTIGVLVDELVKEITTNYDLEIILVNDGSTDNSHEVCNEILRRHSRRIVYIRLAKNFGEHNAAMAGLNHVSGKYAVIIDDDFQNPPQEVEKLVETAVNGKYDVVYSYYEKKYHSWFRNLGSRFNNFVAGYLLDKPRGLYLSSFKCLSAFVVREVTAYKGSFPYIDGLILRATSNIGTMKVRHAERREGKSGYTLRKLVHLWLNMFVNFSVLPLRVSTILGFVFSLSGGVFSVYLVIDKLFIHPDIPLGVTSIMVAILVFSGIQLIMLGLIGEYIGKEFLVINQTPQYVIRELATNEGGDRHP